MAIAAFLIHVLAFHFCSANPIFKDAKIPNFKRTLLDSPDTSVTDKIVIINQESGNKKLYEADIMLTDHDHVDTSTSGDIDGPIKTDVKRNAQRSRQNLWTTRVVPYEFDSVITEYELEILKKAIQEFNGHSCLKWIPKRDQDTIWVKFVKKDGCFSSVGKKYWIEGSQDLSLGSGCYSSGTIQHEMLHASGFWHEQSRPDRNDYVQVMWENIEKDMQYNFNKYSHLSIDNLKKNYDYDSVMHYGKYGFSKNGQPTLLAIGDPNKDIGQRSGLSPTDILELNALYDCQTPSGGWSRWTEFSPCDSQCYKYRQRFCTAEDRSSVCPEANLYGIQTEYIQCPQEECNAPVDGHWGRWSSWGSCSTTCGDGTKTRTRACDDPAPKNGGAQCPHSNTDTLQCNIRSCGLGPDDCEFEGNPCFWNQTNIPDTSPQPWMLNSGSTSSAGTGPTGDHTTGSGKYIYSESSAPAAPGNTARLVSKTFPPTSGRCMTFWYSMYGSGMGSLNVYIQNVHAKSLEKVWSLSGDQGQQWKKATVTIDMQSNYQIMFETVRGSSYESDIALDDVSFKEAQCQQSSIVTTIAPATQAPTTVPPTNPPADFCDFGTQENMYCTWYNDPNNDKTADNYYQFSWFTHQGHSPSASTGPLSGHGGSGYYAYIEASSPFQPGMKAKLLSKQYQASSSMCFDFWYFMYGSGVGTLSVGLENTAGSSTLWSQSGSKEEKWLHAKVPLSSTTTFKIVIEGTRGSSYLGDIAIDDLRVSYGPCA